VSDPDRDYFNAAAASNRSLQEMFGDFYEKLRSTIEGLIGEPVTYEPELLALPGVHVFRGSGIRTATEGSMHFDMQFQRLRFPTAIDRHATPISVTIPLSIPLHGTGLQVYDVTYADYDRAFRMGRIRSLEELVRRKTSAYYPYQLGNLVLHRRLVLHGLSSPGPTVPGDERITVQGHGIRCGGKWILYW
jgi:hypothetical protein